MKPHIICIVGPSGCGKTTLAKFIKAELGIDFLVSYTTRPKRENEINGVDHWFVRKSQRPKQSEILAYTVFNGYQYWTELKDVMDKEAVLYIIDEKGLLNLMEQYEDRFIIDTILIKRNQDKLIETVGKERVLRDHNRIKIDENSYDAVISNNGSLLEFFEIAKQTISLLIQ